MSKEYCWNCGLKISSFNWRVGRFRCHKCYGKDEVADKITWALKKYVE